MTAVADHNPRTLITLENPFSLWYQTDPIRTCAARPGWKLHEVIHYCANTTAADGAFPKKPTSFLVFGAPDEFKFSVCADDCPHRIKGSSILHKLVICRHRSTHAEQTVITDVMEKGKIPAGVFEKVWLSHREHVRSITTGKPQRIDASPPIAPPSSVIDLTIDEATSAPNVDQKATATKLKQQKISFAPALHAATSDRPYIQPTPDKPPLFDDKNVTAPVDLDIRIGHAPKHPISLARVEYLAGKTFRKAFGFRFWHDKQKRYLRYSLANFKYDLAQGYIHVGKSPAKQPKSAADVADEQRSYEEMLETYFTAFLAQPSTDPLTRRQAMLMDKQTGTTRWKDAERAEFKQLQDLGTFETVDKVPTGASIYSCKIVWKDKPGINGAEGRAKARLCVRNFKTDLNEDVFAPVCRIEAVRMLMSELSVHPDWDVNHIDVCNAFCTAPLEKFIYIHPPEGMIEDNPSLKGKFLCVKNALYGLAASPRAFNQHLHKRVTSYG